jgi:regulator of RNase E activity RraA
MVVDGGGSCWRALLGDQVAMDCVDHRWEGLVIYRWIRDVDDIQAFLWECKLWARILARQLSTTKAKRALQYT